MTAIMYGTKYDYKYRKATGSLGYAAGVPDTNESIAAMRGTPADEDYINRWVAKNGSGLRDDINSGALPSGYYHYMMYGKDLGGTYNFALNDAAPTATKSKLIKYALWAAGLIAVFLIAKKLLKKK
jgi:hypothetical protein